jgi:HEAT repeats
MKTKWTRIQNPLTVALIVSGSFWGVTRQFSVYAKGPESPSSTAESARQSNGNSSTTARLENASLQVRAVSGALSDTINRWAAGTTKAAWLAYTVAEVNGEHSMCCSQQGDGNYGTGNCGTCRLENSNSGTSISNNSGAKIELEASRQISVFFRAESGKIGQIRVVSERCTIDAGGLAVVWLENVNASESVNFLKSLVSQEAQNSGRSGKLSEGTLTAIALHADPSADRAMESFVAPDEPVSLRKQTSFWLGDTRGAEGLRILRTIAQSDPSDEVREQVTFALSISREPGALPEMIRMAHDDKTPRVRGQALFWLGQKAGEQAAKAITGSIDTDPDTAVKKKAVFALSQMPPDQGVPRLIQVAQTNRNPQVRKEAMFWLGQSNDPQALVFFEKILNQ